MNIAANLATLARQSATDPEPSIWAREVVQEMEQRFFADDEAGEWTPAFRKRLAQFLDLKSRDHTRPGFYRNRNAE